MKNAARRLLGTKPADMIPVMNGADIISFDIFDSLVRRDVPSPESVHHLVEREFFLRTGRRFPDYFDKRTQAEVSARIHASGREITLREIFEEMDSIPVNDRNLFMHLEQEMEYEVCCADPEMKQVFDKAKKAGKHIVITSDMYLPESIIKKILEKCGYQGYERLYLSSSYGVTKASGQLYQHLLHDCRNKSENIIHIGDNVKSDFLKAGRSGITPLLIRERKHILRFHAAGKQDSPETACFRSFLANHKPSAGQDLAVSIGYEVLGPLLWGYCRWLKMQAEFYGSKKIFFLSREGNLLKRAYEELYSPPAGSVAYLHVSRQALQIPLLSFCGGFHELCDRIRPLMRIHDLKSVGDVCHLGHAYEEKLSSLSLKPEDDIFDIPENVQEDYFHLVMELGRDYFYEQYELVRTCLRQEGLSGDVILSDIGWQGTMQQALSQYCRNDTVLRGCYMGCWNPPSESGYSALFRRGYLTEPGQNRDMELLLRFSCDIVETLFSSPEGSVAAYAADKDKVIPILRTDELNGPNREFIRQVQEYALIFLRDIKRSHMDRNPGFSDTFASSGLRCLLMKPSLHTVKHFKDYSFLDGTLRSILPEHSSVWYLFHPRRLISDFEKSSCKLFFLKDLLKLPLPYFRFLKLLRENLGIKSSNQKIWLEH